MASHRHLLNVATRAARDAATFIRGSARPEAATWDRKARNDFATDVDRGAEKMIAEALQAGAPGSVVVGEELTPTDRRTDGPADRRDDGSMDRRIDGSVTWVVDPLDGTTNFLHGYPAYAVSIAAVVAEQPVVGVVVDVVRGLTYRAVAGEGAWCDDRPLRVSAITEPALALMGTGFPFKAPASERLEEYLDHFRRVMRATSGIRRAGSAALDLAHVAEGRLDGFWEIGLAAWDVAAGILLVREAGGLVTDFSGWPSPIAHGDFVAGGPAMHAWLLEVIRSP